MKENTVRLENNSMRWLRAEAALWLGASGYAYAQLGGTWLWWGALFLLPDLSMILYWRGQREGAAAYNLAHSYVAPALGAVLAPSPLWLIWVAHIAFDRMAGYGLKQSGGFGDTHLGRVGRASQ